MQLSGGVKKAWAKTKCGGETGPGAQFVAQGLEGGRGLSRGVDVGLEREVVPRAGLGKEIKEGVPGQDGCFPFGQLTFFFVFSDHFPGQDFRGFDIGLIKGVNFEDMSGNGGSEFPEEVLPAEVVAVIEGERGCGMSGLLEGGEVGGGFSREGEGDEEAVIPVGGGGSQRFTYDGEDAFADFPGAFSDELLRPIAETFEGGGGKEGDFVATSFGEFSEDGPERKTWVIGARKLAGFGHFLGAGDQLGEVNPEEGGGDQPKVGERGVTPANVGVVEKNAADLVRAHKSFEAAAGVGDSDEVLAGGFETEGGDGVVEEMFEEGEGFDRAAGFGGNDVKSAGRVEGAGGFEDVSGVGGVQHVEQD